MRTLHIIRLLASPVAILFATHAFAQLAAPDSTAVAPPDSSSAETAPADSAAIAPPDSLDSSSLPPADIVAEPAVAPPWIDEPGLDRHELDLWRTPMLGDAVQLLPGSSVRVAGDRGAPVYFGTDPIAGPGLEILVDGIPTQNPGEFESGLWDRSLTRAAWIASTDAAGPPGGEAGLRVETESALVGRTYTDTHFTREAHDSYLRSFSVATPHASRTISFDFEEWKTEEGYNFTLDPSFDAQPSQFGRSKMRRFRATGSFATGAGRGSFGFGRGRRLYQGTVLNEGGTERWTGEVFAGLDRAHESSHVRWRAYHLDWNVDDAVHVESRDATRLGVSFSRVPRDVGWSSAATVERQSATFSRPGAGDVLEPDAAHVGRWAVGYSDVKADTRWRAEVEGAYASHAHPKWGAGGRLQLDRTLGSWDAKVGARRRVRSPLLAETHGSHTFDLADGSSRTRTGAGHVPFERQDRLFAELTWRRGGVVLGAGLDAFRLTRGIGWEPVSDIELQTRGDLELAVDLARGFARSSWSFGSGGLELRADGHHVLGTLTNAGNRGAGWPLWAGHGRIRLWRHVANRHNRGFLVVAVNAMGPRLDDVLAPILGTRLAAVTRVDARVGLQVRDAELYLGWWNLTNQVLIDVAGTHRRLREIRLGLRWPFFN